MRICGFNFNFREFKIHFSKKVNGETLFVNMFVCGFYAQICACAHLLNPVLVFTTSIMISISVCSGSPEDGPRVVFMVDLWHPNVAAAERQALDYIFTPGR